MIVLLPVNTTHTIKFIPRFLPSDDFTLQLYDETLQTTETITNTYTYLDGIVYLEFDLVCTENQKFQLKILELTEVIYRDKIFVTSQDTQAFKATKDHYYYKIITIKQLCKTKIRRKQI
jgi:hypothetical protein